MVKILLYIENFNEMSFLQTILKKVSFDVEICKNKAAIKDVILTFNPEIIISTSKGQKVDGLELVKNFSQRTKKISFFMVTNSGEELIYLKEQGLIHGILKSPINPRDLLSQIADLKSLDVNKLLEKYENLTKKTNAKDDESLSSPVRSGSPDKEDDVFRIKGDASNKDSNLVHVSSEREKSKLEHITSKEKETLSEEESLEAKKSNTNEAVDDVDIVIGLDEVINIESELSDVDRKKKTQEFLKKMDKVEDMPLLREKVRAFNKSLRNDASLKEDKELRRLKRVYVESLLDKNNQKK